MSYCSRLTLSFNPLGCCLATDAGCCEGTVGGCSGGGGADVDGLVSDDSIFDIGELIVVVVTLKSFVVVGVVELGVVTLEKKVLLYKDGT